MTSRIRDFLNSAAPTSPCLIVDLEIIKQNYRAFESALPDSAIFYAIKANPAPEILSLLTKLGSKFDCASAQEIDMALSAGAEPLHISYGNTIKKECDIAKAFDRGVRLFAVDCHEEVEKVSRTAPGSMVFCRILTDGEGAEWPLSRKFGCTPQMAVDVLAYAHQLGLVAHGVSFHVGSQQTDINAWNRALGDAKHVFNKLQQQGIKLELVNMGGGFPTRYLQDVPTTQTYGRAIVEALRNHFGNDLPKTIIEPGRGMVGNAGILKTEVILVSKKSNDDDKRWVFLDVGKFGGLAETMDEAIRYRLVTQRENDQKAPCVVAGPTCDSADVLYERTPYDLPVSLTIGDEILIEDTGAYTTTYSAVAFNGFAPLKAFII